MFVILSIATGSMKSRRKIIQNFADHHIFNLRLFGTETREKITAEPLYSMVCENNHDMLYWMVNTLK